MKNQNDEFVLLEDVASVIRSKIAGPFRVTMDVIFPSNEIFESIVESGVFSRQSIARLYGVPLDCVTSFFEVPIVNALKFTMKRTLEPKFLTSDSHGAQQHVPLMSVKIPRLWIPDSQYAEYVADTQSLRLAGDARAT